MDIDKIIADLGANYKNDEEVLKDIIESVISIASDITNREKADEKLFPYVKRAVKAEYLRRGAEGMNSSSEGGQSYSFENIIETMRNDLIKSGLRRLK